MRKRKPWKKGCALGLAVAMATASVPSVAFAVEPEVQLNGTEVSGEDAVLDSNDTNDSNTTLDGSDVSDSEETTTGNAEEENATEETEASQEETTESNTEEEEGITPPH
ncbi:MAG: hypothetical protein Q4D90_06400 [bacterium]|nr:hypothetical protein [bacterium]